MSAGYVRDTVRQFCQDVAAAEAVPFYDTINRSQNPGDPVWFTVEFMAQDREGMYCAEEYQETGLITVLVIARPGIGDAAAIDAIERVAAALWQQQDPNGLMTLEDWEPIFEDSLGSADRDYRVGVLFSYRHSNQ